MKQNSNDIELMPVGGQAVIEGVMMRSKGTIATAIRRRNGEIYVKKEAFNSYTQRYPVFKLPVLRGAIGLIEMLIIGIKTLNLSAEIMMEDLVDEKNGHAAKKKSSLSLALTLVLALALGITIFFVAPLYIATHLFNIESHVIIFNLVTGAIRIAFLLSYMALIGISKELQRVFQYHGAEHKSVFTFEAKNELTTSKAMGYSRFHPRCGTSFLLIVMVTAIAFFSILDGLLISIFGFISLPVRLLTHLPLIPLLAGVSYELIKFSAKHKETPLGRLVIAPGLWLQRITTREPDERQVEVALFALKAAIGADDSDTVTKQIPDVELQIQNAEDLIPSELSTPPR